MKNIIVKLKKAQNRPRFLIVIGCLLLVLALFFYLFKDLPSPTKLSRDSFPVSTEIFDRNGTLLYEIYSEQNRTPIKLQDIPLSVRQATIAIEDKDFYKHKGFDVRGILRAAYNIVFKKNLQGGSTITQQLVKTTLLTPERTIRRKIREAVLSSATELIYSKDEILEMYLNHIPYGGTAYGIEQAAKHYFNKNAKDLSLAEAALLVGLPAAPSRYSPFGANPELAKVRQKQVLTRMTEDKYITTEQADEAYQQELHYAPQTNNIKAPHFVLYIKDLLEEKYGSKLVEQGGLRVTTSLDLKLQEFSENTVASEVAKLTAMKVSNGSALITKPKTGEILAMVGSRNYFDSAIDGNVNLTTSLRQPGSSIKPINYAVGLLKGYTPATIFVDEPTCFAVAGQPLYCPRNYDGKFHGPTEMRFALGNSYNLPAVKMLALNGVDSMIATASAMGITTWTDPSKLGLSLTLGGGEVKMTEMAVAFGVFANQGARIDLHPILKVTDYRGKIYEETDFENHPPAGPKVLPSEVTYLISHMLLDNNARVDAFGSSSQLVINNHAVSVKTGTTDNPEGPRDNWTIGYTPSYLVAVWVGNNNGSPMNPWLVSGITGAAPIWHKITDFVLKDVPDEWPIKPENIVGAQVCTWEQIQSDKPITSAEECHGRFEYFIAGTQKTLVNSRVEKKQIWIDKDTKRPPESGKTDNLELQEHLVVSDSLVQDYCLDCPHDNEKPSVIDLQKITSNK
jgi:penicillin-binding protein 1C